MSGTRQLGQNSGSGGAGDLLWSVAALRAGRPWNVDIGLLREDHPGILS